MSDKNQINFEQMREHIRDVEAAEQYAAPKEEESEYPIVLPRGKYYVVLLPHPGAPAFTSFLFRDKEGNLNWSIWRGKNNTFFGGEDLGQDTLAATVQLAVQAKADKQLVMPVDSKIGLLFIPD